MELQDLTIHVNIYIVISVFNNNNPQCYYIGGTEDAATGMLKEVVKPLSYHKPADKICENLKKIDAQICELQYGKYHLSCFTIYYYNNIV